MSHWTNIKVQMKDPGALAAAVAECGGRLVTVNAQARGWAGAVRKCDMAIVMPGQYDVAITRKADGSLEFSADFYDGSIVEAFGTQFNKLKQLYGVHHATQQARRLGHNATRVLGQNGAINVVITGRL